MSKNLFWGLLIALPIAIGGIVYASSQFQDSTVADEQSGFICPITGEELPCEKCCPLN